MAELLNLYVIVGNNKVPFRGAKWFYNDADVRSKTGVKLESEAVEGNPVPIVGQQGKQFLVRLAATLKPDSVVGNSGQSDKKSKRFLFYCDPAFAEECIKGLTEKTIDPSLLPGSYRIKAVYRPLVYRGS